jgi:hypothetical protein
MEKNMPLEMVRKEPETKGRNTSPQVRVRINSFSVQDAMSWVALQMLTGDRAKYMGLIFTIAFSSFLIAQQGFSRAS